MRTILKNAAEVFFKQAFRDGFFHADQHPGNAFVEAQAVAIVAVDFGIMGRVDKATRHYLADMLLAFLQADYERVAEIHFRAGYVPAHKDKAAFTQAIRAIAEPILGLPLAEISLAKLLGLMFQVTERFEMETQPQLLLLQKTMLVTEGVGRTLDPTINMWELARPAGGGVDAPQSRAAGARQGNRGDGGPSGRTRADHPEGHRTRRQPTLPKAACGSIPKRWRRCAREAPANRRRSGRSGSRVAALGVAVVWLLAR